MSIPAGQWVDVLKVFLRLGLTSFGGPIAHLGYFQDEIVVRRKWVDQQTYSDIVALCQFLPGPASSQVGLTLGLIRGGYAGALAAWVGFTLPSAIALAAFGLGVAYWPDVSSQSWLNGLRIVAVAVVAQAVWTMGRSLITNRVQATIAVLAAIAVLLWASPVAQIAVILLAGGLGWRLLAGTGSLPASPLTIAVSRRVAIGCLGALVALLVGLPILSASLSSAPVAAFDDFFRTGSLVFGGGHVVLPLLEAQLVAPDRVTSAEFVAGYGAAQAVPGPLFTFAAYLGATYDGVRGAIVALLAIFLPSFLLVFGTLPFWDALRSRPAFQAILAGVNAAVVGILLGALYSPVWTSAIPGPREFAIALAAFALLVVWKRPPWQVVVFSIGAAVLLT